MQQKLWFQTSNVAITFNLAPWTKNQNICHCCDCCSCILAFLFGLECSSVCVRVGEETGVAGLIASILSWEWGHAPAGHLKSKCWLIKIKNPKWHWMTSPIRGILATQHFRMISLSPSLYTLTHLLSQPQRKLKRHIDYCKRLSIWFIPHLN